MMKNLLFRSAVLLLIGTMLFGTVGCAAITEGLDSIFKTETQPPDDDDQGLTELTLPPRVKETYTFLIMSEAAEASVLDHVMLISFNTAAPSIAALQIPTDLYLRMAEQSLEGLFQKRYESAVEEGLTVKEAVASASEAVMSVLSSGFNSTIDYYVNFSSAQLSGLVNTLGGVELTVPFTMGGLTAGKKTLNGNQVIEYLSFDDYSNMPQTHMDARKNFVAALHERARTTVDSEILSLFVMDLRTQMTTNIPSDSGEDIFFVRKWLQTAPEDFKIANIATQQVLIGSTPCRFMYESNALVQMNELLAIYEEDMTAELFDPQHVFIDYSSDVAKAVYDGATSRQPIYTVKQLLDGALLIKR